MLAAVVIVFMVCWTPILLFQLYVGIEKIFTRIVNNPYSDHTILLWLKLLAFVNSAANFFVYYLTSE